jgi:CRISPR-associated protein Cas4
MTYQNSSQINGTHAHKAVDGDTYDERKDIITSLEVYSERYNLVGKIDIYDKKTLTLTERKKHISKIYDGYVFQIYAQYFAMTEMGYTIKRLKLHSMDDNKDYNIALPDDDFDMKEKFEDTIDRIKNFSMEGYQQTNVDKCRNCIYEPACDRGLV